MQESPVERPGSDGEGSPVRIRASGRLAVVILTVGLLGGAGWFWNQAGKDRVIPRGWATVEEGRVYRSGQLSSALVKDMLARHQVKVIVALTEEVPGDRDQQAERKAAEELGIELLRFPLNEDGTGDVQQYIEAVAAIVEAKRQTKPVLVHGRAGARRTGGMIACYRLLVEGRPPAYVLDEMRRCGWKPKDTRLLAYLNQNLGTIAASLQERGIIEPPPGPLPVLSVPR